MKATGYGRASAILASGTLVSRALGFVRAVVLTAVVGVLGTVADAFSQATYVPTSIYALIGGGLLSAIFVPQIVRASRGADAGVAYVNKLVTLTCTVLLALTILLTACAPLLMRLYIGKPDVLAVAIPLAFWSLPQIFFLGVYAVLGEVLNARRRFGAYTWAPVANNVIAIGMLGVFVAAFGAVPAHRTAPLDLAPTAVLAGGATLGLVAQALVLVLVWRRAGLTFRPDFRWRGVGLKATGQAAGWTFAMLTATQIAGLIQVRVASGASGATTPSVAAMAIAWLIFMLPHSIVTVSLVTVFYPRMSEHAAAGDLAAVRDDLAQTLRVVLLVLVLATATLLAAALPVAAVFSRTPAQSALVAPVLAAYLLGLLPFTVLFVLQRGFYALADTRTPFRFTLAQLAVVVPGTLLCLLLPPGATAAGIALVLSIGSTVQVTVAAVLLHRRIGPFASPALRASVRRYVVAAVPALAAGLLLLWLAGGFAGGWPVAGRLGGVVGTVAVAVVCALVYLVVLVLQRAPEPRLAFDLLRSRLRR